MSDLILPAVILLAIAGIVMAIRRLSKRARELAELCKNGRDIEGVLTDVRKVRRSRTDNNHYVRYTFKSSAGIDYSREMRVSEHEFSQYTQGQAIDIVYLPFNPSIHALKTLVDKTRQAMHQS